MSPAVSKKEDRGAARRQQILQAAIACFSRKGYHLTTMDDIVAESGMSKGSLYWHYESKKDILLSVADWYFGEIVGEMMAAVQETQGAGAKINVLLALFGELLNADDVLINVFIDFYAETRHDDDVTEAVQGMMTPLIDAIAAIIDEGVAAGEFRPTDARSAALLFMAAGDGLILYKQVFAGQVDWDAVADYFSLLFLSGLYAAPGGQQA